MKKKKSLIDTQSHLPSMLLRRSQRSLALNETEQKGGGGGHNSYSAGALDASPKKFPYRGGGIGAKNIVEKVLTECNMTLPHGTPAVDF